MPKAITFKKKNLLKSQNFIHINILSKNIYMKKILFIHKKNILERLLYSF